jgi:hypothetical protein
MRVFAAQEACYRLVRDVGCQRKEQRADDLQACLLAPLAAGSKHAPQHRSRRADLDEAVEPKGEQRDAARSNTRGYGEGRFEHGDDDGKNAQALSRREVLRVRRGDRQAKTLASSVKDRS